MLNLYKCHAVANRTDRRNLKSCEDAFKEEPLSQTIASCIPDKEILGFTMGYKFLSYPG